MKRGIVVPNVGSPTDLVALARDAEAAGWDGFYLWDHVQIVAGGAFDVVDPWMVLAAVAGSTSRLRLGTAVTPLTRRRPWNVAKQLVTLDHLSGGRATLGVGLGFPATDELAAFGETTELRTRAARTDEALRIIDQALRGHPIAHDGDHYRVHAHLRPPAVQSPRPPIWIAATPPHRAPLRRAARWDGVVCNVKLDDDLLPLRPNELVDYLGDILDNPDVEVVTNPHPEHGPDEYDTIGVDWLLDTTWPAPDWLAGFRAALGLS